MPRVSQRCCQLRSVRAQRHSAAAFVLMTGGASSGNFWQQQQQQIIWDGPSAEHAAR
jgi:hypothetical protein